MARATEQADPTATDPNLARLRATLDAIEEPAWAEGEIEAPAFALQVGKDTKSAFDAAVPAWLTKLSEPAPFGHGGKTKIDPAIRKTLRVKQRGKAKIHGLDVGAIVEKVEQALGTDRRIAATLLDILVYPKGAKFVRHKDTPRAGDQLGTLIVEVPCAHTGGALFVGDDDAFPWQGKPKKGATTVRWVALFGDVDHEIEPVRSGTRITLVFTLALTATPRVDADFGAKLDALADAIITLVGEGAPTKPPKAWAKKTDPKPKPIYMIPCARLVVAPTKGPLTLDALRGQDRAIADTFVRCGIPVRVCELLMAQDERQDFPTLFWGAHEITAPLGDIRHASVVSFTDDAAADDDDVDDGVVTKLGPSLDDKWIHMDDNGGWIVRKAARATVAYTGLYSETGYFGNEASDGYIYRCAALEVDFSQAKKPKPKQSSSKKQPATKKPKRR